MTPRSILPAALIFTLHLTSATNPVLAAMAIVESAIEDHGYPAGTMQILNHRCRSEGWEGPVGGSFGLAYRGGAKDLNDFLEAYAEVDFATLDLVVVDDTARTFFRRRPLDWSLSFQACLVGEDYKPILAEIRYCVTVHPEVGSVAWENVKIPEEIRVIDLRNQCLNERTRVFFQELTAVGFDVTASYRYGLVHFEARQRGTDPALFDAISSYQHGPVHFEPRQGPTDHSFIGKGRTESEALGSLVKEIKRRSDDSLFEASLR